MAVYAAFILLIPAICVTGEIKIIVTRCNITFLNIYLECNLKHILKIHFKTDFLNQ